MWRVCKREKGMHYKKINWDILLQYAYQKAFDNCCHLKTHIHLLEYPIENNVYTQLQVMTEFRSTQC